MEHLHMRGQGMQSTRNKTTDTELQEMCNTNVFYELMCNQVQQKRGNFTLTYADDYKSHLTKEINTSM